MAKPFLTLQQQLDLLLERGLVVADKDLAIGYLRRNNYYRFSGYAREFQRDPRNQQNQFIPDTSFDLIVSLMDADRKLRRYLLQALEPIEIASRSAFAYSAGRIFGSEAFYLDRVNYLEITPGLDALLEKIRAQLRRSGQPSVERYRNGNDLSQVPIWVAIEAISFGTFAKLSQYLADGTAIKETADHLSIQHTGFSDALHAFSNLRNRCAHHGQLWNRSFDIAFKVLPKERRDAPEFKHPGSYGGIIVINRWLKRIDPQSTWFESVSDFLKEHPVYADGILNPRMK